MLSEAIKLCAADPGHNHHNPLAVRAAHDAANCRHRPPPPRPSDAERAESAGDQSVARVHAGMTREEVLAVLGPPTRYDAHLTGVATR